MLLITKPERGMSIKSLRVYTPPSRLAILTVSFHLLLMFIYNHICMYWFLFCFIFSTLSCAIFFHETVYIMNILLRNTAEGGSVVIHCTIS